MSGSTVTNFKPSRVLFRPLAECAQGQPPADPGAPDAEWAGCILSQKTVVYGSGVIARRGEAAGHAVDRDELDLCRRLAKEAARMAKPITEGGFDTEGEFRFEPFYVPAPAGSPPVGMQVDSRLVRARFGGTIFPPAAVAVERIRDRRAWWSEVAFEDDPAEEDCDAGRWRELIGWFLGRPEFRDRAFVAVGDYVDMRHVRAEGRLPAKALLPCVFPRLVVGLTKAGSLAGVVGHVTQT